MHPVKFLMDEIYHDYWGIPERRQGRVRRREALGKWFRSRPPRQDDSTKS
ncbi:hypothetical protein [Arvimicrobium flavum]|nr:hypothetical protein [Mesorhizobium shangrilense]